MPHTIVPIVSIVTIFTASILGLFSCAPKQGKSPFTSSTRSIVNGTLVQENSEISASSVLIITDLAPTLGFSVCSGTLIAKNLVLTAAHCILRDDDPALPFPANQIDLFFGAPHLSFSFANGKKTITDDRAHTKAFKVVFHENHIGHEQAHDVYDIALIQFQGDLPQGLKPASILPISQSQAPTQKGAQVTVAGFGITQGDEVLSSLNLRQTELVTESDEGDSIFKLTHLLPGDRGICHGDSGGPSFVQADGKSYLWAVNIMSNCTDSSWVLNLADFHEWMEKKAAELQSQSLR